ncbi:TIGR01244 family sulfur transferase [Pelagerythrobacter sp.]|uniref:TIGR01244 family sulfur transferase n=1 Tax=Pelagerythrobacter sp. TaxID=2800702 RepID=UPI0035AFD9F4
MSDFRKLGETIYASPQIAAEDIAAAREQGVTLVINNRPDGEADGQPTGAEIETAARAAGLDYVAIPVGGAGFGEPQVQAMAEALAGAQGKVLAYCRSGTRSTLLWSLAQAQAGRDPEDLATAAADAGYDVTPVRPAMDMLAARARN